MILSMIWHIGLLRKTTKNLCRRWLSKAVEAVMTQSGLGCPQPESPLFDPSADRFASHSTYQKNAINFQGKLES